MLHMWVTKQLLENQPFVEKHLAERVQAGQKSF